MFTPPLKLVPAVAWLMRNYTNGIDFYLFGVSEVFYKKKSNFETKISIQFWFQDWQFWIRKLLFDWKKRIFDHFLCFLVWNLNLSHKTVMQVVAKSSINIDYYWTNITVLIGPFSTKIGHLRRKCSKPWFEESSCRHIMKHDMLWMRWFTLLPFGLYMQTGFVMIRIALVSNTF